uniref:Lactase n=1 Tax=Echeneis naucrates TaxID=173247 RepID=A0A665VBE8_ECHNA
MKSFPADFQWATSSESFKVEGGWAEGGKGETIWDRFGHKGLAFANQTADLACDSFHKVDYDVYLLRGLNVNTYQFSISWARIFPSGHRNTMHLDGVNVQRFTVQSLMDGFEGPQGYSQQFGLHHVDFDLPDRPRTPKQSAYFYSQIIEKNGFQHLSWIPLSGLMGIKLDLVFTMWTSPTQTCQEHRSTRLISTTKS